MGEDSGRGGALFREKSLHRSPVILGKTLRLGSSGETEAEFPRSNPHTPRAAVSPTDEPAGQRDRPFPCAPRARRQRRARGPGAPLAPPAGCHQRWAGGQGWLWELDGVTFPSARPAGVAPAGSLRSARGRAGLGLFSTPLRCPGRAARVRLPAPFQPRSRFGLGGMSVPRSPNRLLVMMSLSLHLQESDEAQPRPAGGHLGCGALRGSPNPQDLGAGRASRGSSKLPSCRPGASGEQPGRARPGHPLTRGGPRSPRDRGGGSAVLGQVKPWTARGRGGGTGRGGPGARAGNGSPRAPPNPGPGQDGASERVTSDSAAPAVFSHFCSLSHLLYRIN